MRISIGGFLSLRLGFGSVLDDFQQLFARPEEGNPLRDDYDLLAGLLIARDSAAALTGGKRAKPADFHSAAVAHCLEDAFKGSLNP